MRLIYPPVGISPHPSKKRIGPPRYPGRGSRLPIPRKLDEAHTRLFALQNNPQSSEKSEKVPNAPAELDDFDIDPRPPGELTIGIPTIVRRECDNPGEAIIV